MTATPTPTTDDLVPGGAETMTKALDTGYRCTEYTEMTLGCGLAFRGTISDAEAAPVLEIYNHGSGGADQIYVLDQDRFDTYCRAAEPILLHPDEIDPAPEALAGVLMSHHQYAEVLNKQRNMLVTPPGEDFWLTGSHQVITKSASKARHQIMAAKLRDTQPGTLIWSRHSANWIPAGDYADQVGPYTPGA